jgi:N utilization substance protein A
MDVLAEARGPQIILSRTHPSFLMHLFRTEVPEISEGIVNIVAAAREPGSRAKIAVSSNDLDIDPVGACVGMKGSRVQNVVQELRGEKIDIIPWHVDPAKFVCNALAPAEISRVIIDEDDQSMEVIVPDEFLSVAIGKRGQNVRLASKLTGWHLDVKSESRYSQAMKDGYESLMGLEGVSIGLADALYESGLFSAEELSKASVEDLMQIRDMDEEKAVSLIEEAETAVEAAREAAAIAEAEAAARAEAGEETPEPAEEAPEPESESASGEADAEEEPAASEAPTDEPGVETIAETDADLESEDTEKSADEEQDETSGGNTEPVGEGAPPEAAGDETESKPDPD